MNLFKNFILIASLSVGISGQAESRQKTLAELFKSMNSFRGPMGRNVIQGTGGRSITPSSPPGKRLFQGIFRSNDSGRAMARNYDFYVGNLFSSNYYELMETYVFGIESNNPQPDTAKYNPYRELDHAALLAKGAEALPRAASMTRHWILEKYYVTRFPNSTLALAFQRWGVADSADEQIYASLFLNFYLSIVQSDLQYLPAFMLIRHSPVGDSKESPSLQRARDLVAEYPNDRESLLGRIRNAIHNQLSPNIIDMIDQYKRQEGYLPDSLVKVRSILVSYFSFSPSKSAVIAKRLGLTEMERVANILAQDEAAKRVSAMETLLAFSQHAVALKAAITTPDLPTENKADALLLLSYATQFLNSRLTNDKRYGATELSTHTAIQCVLNTIYAEGLLIRRNWQYFSEKARLSQDKNQLSEVLAQATKIGTDTLIKSFDSSLEQWKSLEPKMEGFVDSAIKSSSLNTASVVLLKLRN